MAKKILPRGIRNCNPLNIRRHPYKRWVGEVDYKSTFVVNNGQQCETRDYDKKYCQFEKMEQGYRAAALMLHDYIKRGCNTLEKILGRWKSDDIINIDAFVNAVAHYCQASPADFVIFSASDILPLMAAMTIVENGAQYDTFVENGTQYDPSDKNNELRKDMYIGFRLAEDEVYSKSKPLAQLITDFYGKEKITKGNS